METETHNTYINFDGHEISILFEEAEIEIEVVETENDEHPCGWDYSNDEIKYEYHPIIDKFIIVDGFLALTGSDEVLNLDNEDNQKLFIEMCDSCPTFDLLEYLNTEITL